jgi:putative NADPH-quinone reductase
MSILVIQGHPDPSAKRFCRALGDAYAAGARGASRRLELLDVTTLDFPLLRGRAQWEGEAVPPDIAEAQRKIDAAEHLVIVYPLWLGTMPALLKAFLEQTLRPGFAFDGTGSGANQGRWERQLTGKSARIVVTMGMPAFVYRWYFGAHSLKALQRNILGFCGIGPIKETIIGNVEGCGAEKRAGWLAELEQLGAKGA